MKISYLGQGFEKQSLQAVGNYLIDFLTQKEFDTFTCISAFASESGVYGLSGHLEIAKKNFKHLNLIVGVDLGGTSKEALEEILALDINSYIFYQQEQPVFHPKIYLFESTKNVKLIIGSSNLTRGGLFSNIESSVLIEFNMNDDDGKVLLSELKKYYQSLFDFSDPNLFKISSSTIEEFYNKGIVPDETTRKKIFAKVPQTNTTTATTNVGQLSTQPLLIPKRDTAKVPASFPSKEKLSRAASVSSVIPTLINTHVTVAHGKTQRELVWQKRSLSKSDAQRVLAGSNPTGNLKLSQARFKLNNAEINQTTYFRHHVFNHLIWIKTKANNNTYEEAHCLFEITILGSSKGLFTLKLSHDPVRIAGQGNTPTWLHWGNTVIPFLQQNDITGRTLNLYEKNQSFSIEIA